MTRDLYLADPECQGAKGLKRDDARVHGITIGQEVIKCPFLGVTCNFNGRIDQVSV